LRDAVRRAARRIGDFPDIGVTRPDLAPERFRFLVIPAFDYLVVYQAEDLPRARIMRILYGRRHLETVLASLVHQ
jgi:plasmid stabilization system protein ParE